MKVEKYPGFVFLHCPFPGYKPVPAKEGDAASGRGALRAYGAAEATDKEQLREIHQVGI